MVMWREEKHNDGNAEEERRDGSAERGRKLGW